MAEPAPTVSRRAAAWGVHLLTGFGAVIGMLALNAIVDERWIFAFALMAVTLVIDSVDGALARTLKVKEVLPEFDGALLDNIVDYFNYVIVPAFFLYAADLVPASFAFVTASAIALSSAYQFCQTDAKTEDFYFTGFPSYWNLLVFYLFMFGFSPEINLAAVLGCAILVFVPFKYIYPTRTPFLRPLTVGLSIAWSVVLTLILVTYPEHRLWLWLSLLYVAYYLVVSGYASLRNNSRG